MMNFIKITILLFIFPTLVFAQNNQVIKGRSATKRLKYSNTNTIKIKKINSNIKIDSIIFVDINKNNKLDFSEEGFLKCFISNNTSDTLKELKLNLTATSNSNKIMFPANLNIDYVEPNNIFELSIPTKNTNPEKIKDFNTSISFNLLLKELLVNEKNFDLILGKMGVPSVEILYTYSLSKDTVINNTKDTVNYIKLNIAIQNNGDVPIFQVNGLVKMLYAGGYFISDDEEYNYEFINPGVKKIINLDLALHSDYTQDNYPLFFEIDGNKGLFKYSAKINIEL